MTVGINYYSQKKFDYNSGSFFDILPKDAFFRFADEPWMSEILERIKYEDTIANGGVY